MRIRNTCIYMSLLRCLALILLCLRGDKAPSSDILQGINIKIIQFEYDRLCGLVVRVPGYRSTSPDSIPGATRFSDK
jgi:hypothetical protein